MGISFDGDQDRALFADDKGRIVDGDAVLAVLAPDVYPDQTREPVVVGTVMSNGALEALFADRGIRFVRARVGDRYVVEAMQQHGALLGGEPSGHTIFWRHLPTGDGMVTALQILACLRRRSRTLSELAAVLSPWPQKLLAVRVASKPELESVPAIRTALEEARTTLAGRGRLLVRYSGTEDVCRVMVEAREERLADRLARSLAETVRSEIGSPPS